MSIKPFLFCLGLSILIPISTVTSFAQQRGYQFEVGQVLEYEYQVKTESGGSFEYSNYYQINIGFEILEIQSDTYLVKVSLGTYKEYVKLLGDDLWLRRHGRSTIQNSENYFPFCDENQSFKFTLAKDGEISDLQGIEKLYNQAMQRWKDHQPDYRMVVSSDYMKIRYGSDFYRLLLHEIFPPYPAGKNNLKFFADNSSSKVGLRIVHDGNSAMRVNYSFDNPTLTDSLNYLMAKREAIFERDPVSGCVVLANTPGIDWMDYCWLSFTHVRGGDGWDHDWILAQKSIKLVSSYDRNQTQGIIIGNINNAQGKTIHFYEPPTLLYRTDQPFKMSTRTHEQQWAIDLSNVAGFVDLYFQTNDKHFNIVQQFSWRDRLRFYLRPGDTLRFDVDLEDIENVRIEGALDEENRYLNALQFMEELPERTENIKFAERDYKLILAAPKHFNLGFLEQAKFEYHYYLISLRIGPYGFPSYGKRIEEYHLLDSLTVYKPYLDNDLGKYSEAYRHFLRSYSYSLNRVNYSGEREPISYETMTAFRLWDRYFLLSHVANKAILMPPVGYQFYNSIAAYEYFVDEYGDSELGVYLKHRMDLARRFHCGNTLPDVIQEKIRESNLGRMPEGYLILKNDSKFFRSTLPGTEFLSEIDNFGTVVVFLPMDTLKQHQEEINEKMALGKNLMVVGVDEHFLDQIDGMKRGPIIIDPGLTIIGYESRFQQIDIYDLQTWPVIESDMQKSRNLMPLVYSLIGLLLLVLMLFLILSLIAKRKKAKQQLSKKITELELEAVRSRMNPHFLFNALGSIQNLVNSGKVDQANSYLASFGALIRNLLDQSSESIISLKEEIELLRSYLDMEQLCVPFQYDIMVDPELNLNQIELPPLFIQPHVENAIIHGIAKLGENGEIRIEFRKEQNQLVVLVSDNGPGLNQNNQPGNGLGRGWKMTRQRIALLKKQWGNSIKVELLSRDKSLGTLVKFVIPIEKKTE